MIALVLHFLPMLGVAGVIVLAQTQVKERSEKAALALTLGAGLEGGFLLARHFLQSDWLWVAGPLVQVSAVAGVTFGLFTLVDELNPKLPTPLPAVLGRRPIAGPNLYLRAFFGFFGVVGVLISGLRGGLLAPVASVVAIGAALAGSVWLEKQGPLSRWVLERRPDLVVWTYVHQLTVVQRNTGGRTTHWSAQLGLASGMKVALPAAGELAAQQLVGGVMERCPGAVLGFSPENAQRFSTSPEMMRGSPSLR